MTGFLPIYPQAIILLNLAIAVISSLFPKLKVCLFLEIFILIETAAEWKIIFSWSKKNKLFQVSKHQYPWTYSKSKLH